MQDQRALADGKLLAQATEGIGTITFNQPDKRNAISVEMWDALADVLDEWEADRTVRVVVLTGAGDKAFVSGGDISQYEKLRNDTFSQHKYAAMTERGRKRLITFEKPTIAMIRGYCLGGGLAIAMSADLRIASPDAVFGIPAARLGLAYTVEAVQRLISLVGQADARMLLYTARRIDAAEAKRIRLINDIAPEGELESTVRAIARSIGENAPLSVRASKFTIGQALKDESERDLAGIARVTDACFASEDYAEGRRAFLEKRRPVFNGR